jgi:hypothetical protein
VVEDWWFFTKTPTQCDLYHSGAWPDEAAANAAGGRWTALRATRSDLPADWWNFDGYVVGACPFRVDLAAAFHLPVTDHGDDW